jgi:hypothetical protein
LAFSNSSFNRSCRRKLLAPAQARTRTPSWLIRLTFTKSLSTSEAINCVNNSSSAAACCTRKSESMWWFTLTSPQSQRNGALPSVAEHRRANSRAEPTPRMHP